MNFFKTRKFYCTPNFILGRFKIVHQFSGSPNQTFPVVQVKSLAPKPKPTNSKKKDF